MNKPQFITDRDANLKDALVVWVLWMNRDNSKQLGFGNCAGFNTSSRSSLDDLLSKVDQNMAINVQAIYEGLPHSQQLAIDHFHLAAVWRSNRTNIEDDYANALDGLKKGLVKRGLI